MANNNEDPKPVRKTWIMLKKAPEIVKNVFMTKDNKKFMTSDGHEFLVKENGEEPEPAPSYISYNGAIIWTGENGLNENNQWVDISGQNTFTPMNASIVPVYDTNLKLLDFNAYGGMKSSFSLPATTETEYTLELVLRDTDTSSSAGGNWGKILGPEMSSWYNKSNTYAINGAWNHTGLPVGQQNSYSIDYYVGSKQTTYRSTTERQPGVTTITVIPTQGLWVNGIKENEFNLSCVTTQFALASGIGANASYSNTKVKVHSVRYYPIALSEEQIKNNYQVDLFKFNKEDN